MKKTQTVRMMTPGQMKDIISATAQGVPTRMTFEEAGGWVGSKGKLTTQVRKIFSAINPYAELLADWQAFYRDLGINCDNVVIPDDPGVFDRVIIMAQGIDPQSAYDLCVNNSPCWRYTDKSLNEIVESERTARNGAYAIRIRDRVEADEELKNLSANQLKQQNISGITLEERLVYGLKFFKETGGSHLDIANWTLCSGSRYSGGSVPRVRWRGGLMHVSWCNPDDRNKTLRSRQVVS